MRFWMRRLSSASVTSDQSSFLTCLGDGDGCFLLEPEVDLDLELLGDILEDDFLELEPADGSSDGVIEMIGRGCGPVCVGVLGSA